MQSKLQQLRNCAVYQGDCLEVMATLPDDSIDSCVTDPPYGLKFMGKNWDHRSPGVPYWREILRVLKPGAHLFAFGGTRTQHRMVCAIEDAGFEIRDMIAWVYGSGFPKSHDVSKAIEKMAGGQRDKIKHFNPGNPSVTGRGKDGTVGASRPWIVAAMERGYHEVDSDNPVTEAARQWQGWGTALKPALEPITVARKPFRGAIAANVLKHGTGAINVDGGRVATDDNLNGGGYDPKGRWPANLIHDGSDEVTRLFPESNSQGGGVYKDSILGGGKPWHRYSIGDSGSAARFFYTAKADAIERSASRHPAVKPVNLIQYLCRLVTPPGGTVIDPFAGTGTTGEACFREGFKAILIERAPEYFEDIRRRMELAGMGPDERQRETIKARGLTAGAGPLFDP